jgi:hypothetical protein
MSEPNEPADLEHLVVHRGKVRTVYQVPDKSYRDLYDEVATLRQEMAEAKAEREAMRKLCAEMLSTFTQKGHPGTPALRSGWVREDVVLRWHQTYRAGA